MSPSVLTLQGIAPPLDRESSAAQPHRSAMLRAWWLGQAGFLFQAGGLRMLVDPYLSDSLAVKYRGTALPHHRMVPIPVDPSSLRDIDLVFATHEHGDHLDPGTLPYIAKANPQCRFVVPASAFATAVARGVPPDRILAVDAGNSLVLSDSLDLRAIPSAHEERAYDAQGRSLYLGYIFTVRQAESTLIFYHSGDCCPYPGLQDLLAGVHVLFLPVNGRDMERRQAGILGNFTLEEALDLALNCGPAIGIGHHYGMFDFNTIDPERARSYIESTSADKERFILAADSTLYAIDLP